MQVVLAVTRVFYYAGTPLYLPKIVRPLLRLLNTSKEVERVVLVYLLFIAQSNPVRVPLVESRCILTLMQNLFAPFYTRFLVRTSDVSHVKKDKIKLLLAIVTIDTYSPILRELIVSERLYECLICLDLLTTGLHK
jgi:AP-3 complex subunit beta